MEIVLIRHAQPEWDRADVAQVDPGLTPLGAQQAERLADRLSTEHFDRMLVSTARRAQQTAMPIIAALPGVPHEDRQWLHEIHMPASWQGTPAQEVTRALHDARFRPRDQWWDGMPGGESFEDFHARVTIGLRSELAELGLEQREDGLWHIPANAPRLLLVAHAGTNSVVLGALLGLEPEPWEWERFASDHASITVLRTVRIAQSYIFSLQGFSDHGHLPDAMVTG
ncbi:MAG: histidine phosphatase family protein [Nitriliruptoraceae bacterium]